VGPAGKRQRGPWYGDFRRRLAFERDASKLPGYRGALDRQPGHTGYRMTLTIDVPHYEARTVKVVFRSRTPEHPSVYVLDDEGENPSPHRYDDGALCMWHPKAHPSQRWVFADGLMALVAQVALHLFMEAWWREFGYWLGDEAPHGPTIHGPVTNRRRAA
jgi:hypothetical protein